MLAIKKLIPHLFTAGNLVGGILAIIFTLNGNIFLAPFCIFASAIFDFLDGFVARLLKVQGELGKQLDSLADMVTFGVAPGIILYKFFLANDELAQIEGFTAIAPFERATGDFSYFSLIAFLIPIFALFRLAKFNLDTIQNDSFIGLPTPAMTIFVASLPLMCEYIEYDWQIYFVDIMIGSPWGLSIMTISLSVLMVVELPLFALKIKNFKWKGNEIRYIFLTISLILLITLLWWALPLIIILYVILSLLVKPKKNEIQS